MEHLPTQVGNPRSVFPPIPHLCKDKYDGGPFLEYPRRLGLPNLKNVGFRLSPNLNYANKRFLAAMPAAELELFLQNWLFFGLLHEVLGASYRHDDFVTKTSSIEGEKSIITTACLVSRLDEWAGTMTHDEVPRMAAYKHIVECLNLAHACLKVDCPGFDNDLQFHLASVAELVGYATSKACNVAWTTHPRESLLLPPALWGEIINEGFRKSILLERSNCCPSQVQMLMETFRPPQALAFVASCFGDDTDRSRHASCEDIICRAGNPDGHIPRHVSHSCGCECIHVDEDLLIDCLTDDCLPLLRLKEEPNLDRISVEVVPSTKTTRYVALSHVWADGLGNPKATALPRCQLLRLKALIDELDRDVTQDSQDSPESPPEMLLWCDTLCCPVASSEGKRMALAKMYRTYDEASEVLVLDQGLISCRVGGMSVDEACLRVAASRWMTRLWTLQEGALPGRKNNLWFQFTKTALHVRTLYGHIHDFQRTDIRRRGVAHGVTDRFHTFMTLFDATDAGCLGANLQDIMKGLEYRSVTVSSDEPLIIANLQALDLDAILASEPAERMQALWRTMSSSAFGIHKEILFQLGPRMDEPGFRWAPSSLLSIDRHFLFTRPDGQEDRGFLATHQNARGLLVEFAGLRISIANPASGLPKLCTGFDSLPKKDPNRHNILLRDRNGRWYCLKHLLYGESNCPPDLEDMCTVISRLSRPWILHGGSTSLLPESRKGLRGIVVDEADEQQSRSEDFTCVDMKSHIVFGHLPMEMSPICQAAYRLAQEWDSTAAVNRLREYASVPPNLDDPVYLETLQAVDLELERLSKSPVAVEALAASGNAADEREFGRMSVHIKRIYRGLYFQIEEYAPATRKWCVD